MLLILLWLYNLMMQHLCKTLSREPLCSRGVSHYVGRAQFILNLQYLDMQLDDRQNVKLQKSLIA